MRAGLFVLIASVASATLAGAAACGSFGGGEDTPPTEAGLDALPVVEACPNGPTLVEPKSVQPDARCGANGAVVDLSSREHCGACGHACGAGACAVGMCALESLLSGESIAAAQVVGTKVYFVRKNRVVARANLTDKVGIRYQIPLPLSAIVKRVEVAGSWLYLSTPGGSQRVELEDATQEDVPPGVTDRDGVIAAGPNGYFYATRSGVEQRAASGLTTTISSPGTTNIVADGDNAYWTTSSDAGAAVHGPFPIVDPPLTALAASAVAMAVDATHVYFADPAARLIRRIARAGGTLQSVAAESSTTIGSLAVNGDYVYWTADHGSAEGWVVMRAGKCGGLPLVLAKDLAELTQLSFDATYVYTVKLASARGELIRVAK